MIVAICLLNIYSSLLQEPSQWHVENLARLDNNLVIHIPLHDYLHLANCAQIFPHLLLLGFLDFLKSTTFSIFSRYNHYVML